MSIGVVVVLLFHFFVDGSSCIEHDLCAFGMASRVSPIGEGFLLVHFVHGTTALVRVTAWPLSGESDG